ncbi:MAG: MBL fold metallo-hydrolase [Nitrospiraceae bacterium]|nr:MAG: MBL fold metallo-hydrolase [Nitrospiraceae bacterium]
MKNRLHLGSFELCWLDGGTFALDGGAMFGVVPKKVWEKKYRADNENFIPLAAWPILVKTPEALVLIETGIGNKLTEKQRKIFRVHHAWNVPADLESLGISREDIDVVVLTHGDFDHAGGIAMEGPSGPGLTFPNARHVIQKQDWDDVLNPNRRAANSYWAVNFEALKNTGNLSLVEGEEHISKGIRVIHTGGHHAGHQVVRLESQGQVALHLGDLFPTHAHYNPLWVMAYDDFPLEVIRLKEQWQRQAKADNAWFLFYHDPFVQYCKFDEEGTVLP